MKLPEMQGVVERRLLVNYRVDAGLAASLLPAAFRPQLVNGWAVAGICLIRLGQLRPRWWPSSLGRRSENAAHRIAVEWETPDGTAAGVYIPRRDTNSMLNTLIGGRLFPGEHHRAHFRVHETENRLDVAFDSADGASSVDVAVEVADDLESHLFTDLDQASRFFQAGSLGYSATRRRDQFDGLELRTTAWRVEPARVTAVRSSFFADPHRFPPGSATLDCALVMRDVPVTWHALHPLGDQVHPRTSEPLLDRGRNARHPRPRRPVQHDDLPGLDHPHISAAPAPDHEVGGVTTMR